MSQKAFLLVLVLSLGVVVRARHIHPHSNDAHYEDSKFENFDEDEHADIDGIPIEVIRNLKPQRFVPINNEFFFKKFVDCEDGFRRDFLGICREVW